MIVSMATTNLFAPPGLQGRRLHLQRQGRAPVRHRQDDGGDRSRRRTRCAGLRLLGRPRRRRGDGAKPPSATPWTGIREAINFLCRLRRRPGLRDALRARAEAERAARRHLPADGRPCPGVHRHPRSSGDGRRQPRSRPRDDVGPVVLPRRRPGAVARQALPHRSQRPEDRPLRPGPALRLGRAQGRLLPRRSCSRSPAMPAPRHFDAHAYRGEDAEGVWDFAAGCMRTYLLLKEKARPVRRRSRDPGRAWPRRPCPELAQPTVGQYSKADAPTQSRPPATPWPWPIAAITTSASISW